MGMCRRRLGLPKDDVWSLTTWGLIEIERNSPSWESGESGDFLNAASMMLCVIIIGTCLGFFFLKAGCCSMGDATGLPIRIVVS